MLLEKAIGNLSYHKLKKNSESGAIGCPCYYLNRRRVAKIFWIALAEAKEELC